MWKSRWSSWASVPNIVINVRFFCGRKATLQPPVNDCDDIYDPKQLLKRSRNFRPSPWILPNQLSGTFPRWMSLTRRQNKPVWRSPWLSRLQCLPLTAWIISTTADCHIFLSQFMKIECNQMWHGKARIFAALSVFSIIDYKIYIYSLIWKLVQLMKNIFVSFSFLITFMVHMLFLLLTAKTYSPRTPLPGKFLFSPVGFDYQ